MIQREIQGDSKINSERLRPIHTDSEKDSESFFNVLKDLDSFRKTHRYFQSFNMIQRDSERLKERFKKTQNDSYRFKRFRKS